MVVDESILEDVNVQTTVVNTRPTDPFLMDWDRYSTYEEVRIVTGWVSIISNPRFARTGNYLSQAHH